MKQYFTYIFLLFSLGCSSSSNEFTEFDWLLGNWERLNVKPGNKAFENWVITSNGLSGTGVSLKQEDTVFVEYLKIQKIDNEFYYVAEVSHNAELTKFKVMDLGNDYFKSSNPNHDFPKEINYRISNDTLIATISGDGRSIPFYFVKNQ